MLVCRLHLHSGIDGSVSPLGVLRIANVGGDARTGEYACWLETPDTEKMAKIERFDRRRGAWALVKQALAALA